MRRGTWLLVVALGLALFAVVLLRPDASPPPPATGELSRGEAPGGGPHALPPIRLRGRAAPGARPDGREPPPPPSATRPVAESQTASRLAETAGASSARAWRLDRPRPPSTDRPDPSLSSLEPLRVTRTEIVGQVLPYGELLPPYRGRATWQGVARVEAFDATAPEAGPDVTAPLVTAIRGQVVSETGDPLPDAEVVLDSTFYERRVYYDHRVVEIGRTTTDGNGRFDLRPIGLDTVHFGSDGEVLVTVRHPGYATRVVQPLPGLVPNAENDVGALVLPSRGATVRGRILDLEGRPVAGAFVRVSGGVNPVDYDKTERMVILQECPTAVTDALGRYELGDFAEGTHQISVHVHIDCVLHEPRRLSGESTWTRRVRAGGSVRGRVLDGAGRPLAAAVVAGGGNWTPSNEDGTFWLDNIAAGPFPLEVTHDAWRKVVVPDVRAGVEGLEVVMDRPLAQVTFEVVDEEGRPVPLIALDWIWRAGRAPPAHDVPTSRYWQDPTGRYLVRVPEDARGVRVSGPSSAEPIVVPAEALVTGARIPLVLVPAGPGGGR